MATEAVLHVPLFPLGTVLFPDGLLPLQIFELRYLEMIGRSHREGTPFGIVSLKQGREVRQAGAPSERFAEIGTLAAIRRFENPQAGLVRVECQGSTRFRVRSSEQRPNGLWIAEVEALPGDVDLKLPDDLEPIAAALRKVVETLAQRAQAEGTEEGSASSLGTMPLAEPYRYDDCGWVANRWCELLPLDLGTRQRFMELDSPLMRLELVGDLLTRTGVLDP